MASHKGRDSTFWKISKCFFWYSNYIKSCEDRQKQGHLKLEMNNKLHSIPVPSNAVKQVDVNLCRHPDVDGYRCLIVCIKYLVRSQRQSE